MIMLAIMIAQSAIQESTPHEVAFCSGPQNDQPYRFCLADQKHKRADRELAAAVTAARRGALAQKQEIVRFSRINGGVSLAGDPVQALDSPQRAWTRSYQADCAAVGLTVATGNAGTEGVTTNRDCEANRIFDRIRFLNQTYLPRR